MAELFNREISVNLGGNLISTRNEDGKSVPILRVVFDVELTLEEEANSCDLQIYNLKESTRQLVSTKGLQTTVEAGYYGRESIIFAGELDYGSTTRSGPDWITEFQSTDKGKDLRESRINESMKAGATIDQVVRRSIEKLGVGAGNALEQIKKGNIRGALNAFAGGIVLSGPTKGQMTKLLDAAGFKWSIQQGDLQLLGPTDFIEPPGFRTPVLKSSTGLVGSPQPGEDGQITVKTLLLPELLPGRRVNVQSSIVDGFFRIERTRFMGDTWGGDWYAEIEGKPI